MPKIQQYNSPAALQGIRPSDLGVSANEMAARRVGVAFHQLGQTAEDVAAPMEVSALSNEYAQTSAKLSQDTNAFFKNADPNDPQLYDKYHDQVLQPALDKFASGPIVSAQGQELARRWRDDLQSNYAKTALADQSSVAAGAVHQNLTESMNALSQAGYADPTQHDHLQSVWNETVEAQIAAHHLTPEQGASLRAELGEAGHKQIAVATGQAMAERNPDQAHTDFNSGMFNKYLTGEEVSHLNKYADTQQRASVTAQRAQEQEAKRQQKEQSDTVATGIISRFIQPDGTLQVPPDAPKQIAQYAVLPGTSPGEARAMADMSNRLVEEQHKGLPSQTDPEVYGDFRSRMLLPQTDPRALSMTDVYQARANGQLNDKDFAFWRGFVTEAGKDPSKKADAKSFNQFLRGYKGFMTRSNPLMGTSDPQGDQRFYQFQVDMQERFQDGRAKGVPASDLLDPKSKSFIAPGAVVARYSLSTKQSLQSQIDAASGNVKPLPAVRAPQAGEVQQGYKFLGGDPGSPKSWQKVAP